MRRNLLVILAMLLGMATLQAKPVDVAKAQRLGLNFVQHKAMFAKNAVQDIQLAYIHHADNGMVTMYVFNFNGGYVIVSADDSSSPILGYSDQGQFAYETAPDGLRFMLDELSRGIATVAEQGRPVSNKITSRWNNLETNGVMQANRATEVVEPLIKTRWDQGVPFNMYVPSGCPTGCVATAMAQIMKYWEWPVTGTGEHSYEWGGQMLSANFGATTYDWANMIDYYANGASTQEREAVATLMYHCGVSVNMMYESDGSGAYSADVPGAINAFFSYSDKATFVSKGTNYDDWIALLKSNLDQRFPLYYSGQSTGGGHAFICDGYDEDGLFHFNFGWGGSGNNYLLIDGENFEYSGSQAVVMDFVPDYIYNGMPQAPDNLSVSIDDDVSLIGHLSWTNPTQTEAGEPLTSLDKAIIMRNGFVVHVIEDGIEPGQAMSYDDVVPFFDQYDYSVLMVNGDSYGRVTHTHAVFGPYCEWTVIMTSSDFHGWNGGGITVQNAAGSYIDFLTTNTSAATLQKFPMALGNNNLYWTEPSAAINNLSFKVKDPQNHVVYEYSGPSSDLEGGLLRTLNNSCGNENTCEAPYNLRATVAPDNDQTVILTWDSDHTPEFGYCIYRDGFLFNMSHELTYIDENTDIGGHCYYVTALCNDGETANSNEYCVTSGEGCEPPKDFYFTYSGERLQLKWSPSDNTSVSGYIAYRKTADLPYKYIKMTSSNTTNFRDQTAVPGTEYQYVVVAYYRAIDCTSAYANDMFDSEKFFINVDWSNTPKDLQANYDETDSIVNLRWKPAYKASSYDVLRNGEKIGEVSEAVFVDEDLELGETYCYQIVSHGDEFETNSNEACVNTPEPPVLPCLAPSNLVGYIGQGMNHVEWQAPEDRTPDHYLLYIKDMLLNSDTTLVRDPAQTYYEEPLHVDVTDLIFKVKAVYPECESEFALTADGEDFIRITNLAVNEYQINVKLYPNPTSDQLNIEAVDMTSVSVYDLVGQCVIQMSAENGQLNLDMSQLQNGIYFIKVNTTNGSALQRVVKM